MLLIDDSEQTAVRDSVAVEDVMHEIIDMDLDDSDFEPGTDRELLGLFFPEVRITFFVVSQHKGHQSFLF